MIAFVLGGGGNRGPLEVGALQALLEHDTRPAMLVGTSAGAINAAFLALDPTPAAALELGEMWKNVDKDQVFHGNRLTMLWRFLTGKDSLYANDHLQRLVEETLPPGAERFADLDGTQLYIVATRLDTGQPRVFGDDPRERLLDAIMASTALPPFFPPWSCAEELLIDGGIAADLPVKIALDRGAKEVFALHLVDAPRRKHQLHGLLNIAEQAINNVLSRQLAADLGELASIPGVTLHHVPLTGFYGLPIWDFSHTDEMIEGGRRQMEEYLRASQAVMRCERFSSPRERAKQTLRAAWQRLHGMLISNRRDLEEKLEVHCATSKARS
jgi:NTE family protein